jgi:hypothetical protein
MILNLFHISPFCAICLASLIIFNLITLISLWVIGLIIFYQKYQQTHVCTFTRHICLHYMCKPSAGLRGSFEKVSCTSIRVDSPTYYKFYGKETLECAVNIYKEEASRYLLFVFTWCFFVPSSLHESPCDRLFK